MTEQSETHLYCRAFEDRRPPPPLRYSRRHEAIWQVLAAAAGGLGLWYLVWRWTASLNPDALLFSLAVVMAETCAFIGMCLYFHNLWSMRDPAPAPPPERRSDLVPGGGDGPVSVDIFLPTYDEAPELVRLSIRDACAVDRPNGLRVTVHVLDDGNRAAMAAVAADEGVNYITRDSNIGFKAGNLRNAMEQTHGDFILICDADTRVFPPILARTLGYFRDPDMAWVQTPQWFYDLPPGRPLDVVWDGLLGASGRWAAKGLQAVVGTVRLGEDPFMSDPKLFYDVILRRRNCVYGSFCCGAGSLHRRDAVMEAALRAWADQIEQSVSAVTREVAHPELLADLEGSLRQAHALDTEMTPYKFHVSEDIFTSLILHADTDRAWKSVLHPEPLTRMLSPLDLQSWAVQRFKYAGGTIDIMMHEMHLFRRGLSLRRWLMYGMTFWSYLSPLWTVVFLAAPMIAMATGVAPVAAYSTTFFLHLLPFLLMHELALLVGTWGVETTRGRKLAIAFFSFNLRALWTVARGQKISFPTTPKERQSGDFVHLALPQIAVIFLTVSAFAIGLARVMHDPSGEAVANLTVNGFWGFNNIAAVWVIVRAALWVPERDPVMQAALAPAAPDGERLAA
ncbi:glycosyltransferase [Oceanomicrobium pacificus]|uniref:Glycosyltransferase n=1 Tax=Oceanomicrobium pacificus TaxID=2692916 RepID=A0A6B0TL81_9RHOB|nr:glycosyltransferase [Oceanomicrobium pacificus]MXU64636.1 glycosyltransferase [Oceanomicrobium pacificus]